jgi:superfamily I DNA/RNA helicase
VPSGHFHGVQFYNDPEALCRIAANFVGEGLERGTLAVIIATPDHAVRVESCLRSRGIDVDELKRQGNLATLDARDTLHRFMADGMPNPSAFKRVIGSALADVRRGRGHCTIRAYGEMVDLLWRDGLEAAAIRLETLWNQLVSTDDFKLMCGYSMGNFYKEAAIQEIHDQHSHLIARDGHATVLADLQTASATRH